MPRSVSAAQIQRRVGRSGQGGGEPNNGDNATGRGPSGALARRLVMPWDQAWAMWLLYAALLIFLFSGPARANRK